MRKTSMFHRAQGLLVLLLVSQSATFAGPPKGVGNRVMQSGGQSSSQGGMKVTPHVFVPPMGGSSGPQVIKTMPGKFPSGNPVFNGLPNVTGGGSKGPVLDPGIGNGKGPSVPGMGPFLPGKVDPIFSTGGRTPTLPGTSGGSGPFVPIGGINSKLPIKGGPLFPSGGVIGNGPKVDPIFSSGGKGPKLPGGIDPIFSGGKPKLPKLPGPIIDPGIGNGQSPGKGNGKWGSWGGSGYCYGGNCGPFPPWWYEPCWYPHWHGCYGNFQCPVIQPYPLSCYYQTVYTVPVVTASNVVVEPGMTNVDLVVMAVKVLEPGTPERGTLFRIQLGNKGPSDLDAATRVAIFAGHETKTDGALPRTLAAIPGLAAGKTTELDVRFPKEAYGYPMLIVAVELPKGYRDLTEQDNIAQGEIAGLSGMEPAAQ